MKMFVGQPVLLDWCILDGINAHSGIWAGQPTQLVDSIIKSVMGQTAPTEEGTGTRRQKATCFERVSKEY